MELEHCEFPDDLLYDIENDVWVKALDDETMKIGLTSIHAAMAGKLKEVKFKQRGVSLSRGKSFGTIESPRYFGSVKMPLSGTLKDVNSALAAQPKLANDYPYSDGWFVVIAASQLSDEIKYLSRVESIQDRIKGRIRELHVRCFKAFPDHELWEIGIECAAALARLNEMLETVKVNEVVHLVSDDPMADIEMARWSYETGQELLEARSEGNLNHFIVRKIK